MSNHCIDVVCTGCGSHWCDRGCSFRKGPNEEIAKKAREHHAINPGFVWHDIKCCKGYVVLSDSILYGDNKAKF